MDRARGRGAALEGVRVMELGQHVAGPLLGMLLADQGADVVKVERPGGDPARAVPAFATWNRGKRSIALDLHQRADLEQAHRLLDGADVVVENFRPGVTDRLGVGYEETARRNPRVVYCALPGYGRWSPHADREGWDPVIAAETGVQQVSVGDPRPLYTPLPLPSTFAAAVGATAIAGALLVRDRTGLGQRIEVPLHDAMFTAFGRYLVKTFAGPDVDPRGVPKLPMMHQYRCADGRYVQNHGTFARFVHVLLTVAGRPEWIDEGVEALRGLPDAAAAAAWRERLEGVFLERTAQEWETAISEAGGACCTVRSVEEWLAEPHAREAGLLIDVDDPVYGRMTQPGLGVHLRGTPGRVLGAAPALDADREAVLAEVWDRAPAPPPLAEVHAQPPSPLAGVRVLDLCIILAGPMCGRILAEYGADVVKIDDPRRPSSVHGSNDVNRGKRSLVLDLATRAGKDVFWQLVDTADVLVENYRDGKLDALGVGYEQVRAHKPDIVYASLNAYGYGGRWSSRPGWEQNAQAVTGLQVRRGGRDGRPLLLTYPVNDYGTGLLGAYGVMLALWERARSGLGQRLDTGLAAAATLMQSRYLFDYPGYVRAEPEGAGLLGESALAHLYAARDGWFCLHAPRPADWSGLLEVQGLEPVVADARFGDEDGRAAHDAALHDLLARCFAEEDRQTWLARLAEAGVPAGPLSTLDELAEDAGVRGAGLVVTRDHPLIGQVQHTGPVARLERTPLQLGRPAPRVGTHTEEILAELGHAPEEIRRLLDDRVVVQAGA